MHTKSLPDGYQALVNGDYSGDATFIAPDGTRSVVPVAVVLALSAEYVRDAEMARLEEAGTEELLLGPQK